MRDGQIIRAEASFDSIASNYLWQRVTPSHDARRHASPPRRSADGSYGLASRPDARDQPDHRRFDGAASTTLHGGVGALLAEQANGRHMTKPQSPVSAARGVPYFRLEPSVRPLRRSDTDLRQKLDDIA